MEESGNDSFQAWFVVVNSLMRDAQVLSNPDAVIHTGAPSPNSGRMIRSAISQKEPRTGDSEAGQLLIIHCAASH